MTVLTDMTGKGAVFNWTPACSKLFKEVKAMIAEDTMIIHPNFSKSSIAHTGVSNYQIGGVVSQEDKSL